MNWHWMIGALRGAQLFMVFAALFAGVLVTGGCQEPPPPPPPPPVEPPPPPPPVFTQSQFDALLYGMTMAQVQEVLGAEPDHQESTYNRGESVYVPPSVTAWYSWKNEDGSFIRLGFVEKKLAEMTSESLPR